MQTKDPSLEKTLTHELAEAKAKLTETQRQIDDLQFEKTAIQEYIDWLNDRPTKNMPIAKPEKAFYPEPNHIGRGTSLATNG